MAIVLYRHRVRVRVRVRAYMFVISCLYECIYLPIHLRTCVCVCVCVCVCACKHDQLFEGENCDMQLRSSRGATKIEKSPGRQIVLCLDPCNRMC